MSDDSNAYESPKTTSPAEPGKWGSRIAEWLVVIAIIGVLVVLFFPAPRGAREAARRMQCSNHLKQIALAQHGYHDEHGAFPPAYIADEGGRPTHSWRVLILPYLEGGQGETIYAQYSFEEPWDGPNNRKLWNEIPSVYRCSSYSHDHEHRDDGTKNHRHLTQYVALVGPETVFPRGESIGFADVTDGNNETLLVAEICDYCVHWMSPRDVSPKKFVRQMAETNPDSAPDDVRASHHPGGVNAAFVDSSVQFIPQGRLNSESIRALSTRSAGDEVPSL